MIKPKNFLTSTIHIPAEGSTLSEPEKVPIISKGIPSPIPKAKRSKNPISLLPIEDTIVSSKKSPGDKQGDAIVPLTAPKRNTDIIEPPLYCCVEYTYHKSQSLILQGTKEKGQGQRQIRALQGAIQKFDQ